ncbi:hypothetical protein AVEN_63443-1, partial [Araneus ventricosus]
MSRLLVRRHVQTLFYEMALNWESCVAVGVVVLPSGECNRRWNRPDFWCYHLLMGLKVVACSLTVSHHFGGGIELGPFGSEPKILTTRQKEFPKSGGGYWLIYIR